VAPYAILSNVLINSTVVLSSLLPGVPWPLRMQSVDAVVSQSSALTQETCHLVAAATRSFTIHVFTWLLLRATPLVCPRNEMAVH
jgi:hypothetical protein